MSPILPIVLLFALGAASVEAQPSLEIVGTWEFVSATTTAADGTTTSYATNDLRSTKILNQTHFSVVTRNADGSFRHANVGSYQREGNLYRCDFEICYSFWSLTQDEVRSDCK